LATSEITVNWKNTLVETILGGVLSETMGYNASKERNMPTISIFYGIISGLSSGNERMVSPFLR
jgi:hypothetical protein